MPEAGAVRTMFAGISTRYDRANRILSGGLDLWWRRVLVRKVAAHHPTRVVDLATGSGDVAFAIKHILGSSAQVTGMDFCPEMLQQAELKKASLPNADDIDFVEGDCLALPLEDASVDVLTISFGLRNLEDRQRGLSEMLRVLRPGGVLLVLEFTQPSRWLRPFYYFYLKHILPILARWTTGNRHAYDYLAGSIASFPSRESLTAEFTRAGFSKIHSCGLNGCIVAIHEAIREPANLC